MTRAPKRPSTGKTYGRGLWQHCAIVSSVLLVVPIGAMGSLYQTEMATRDDANTYLGVDLLADISAVECVRLASGAWVAFAADPRWCRVVAANLDTQRITAYGEPGSAPGEFSEPMGIAADSLGNVFVSDTGNNRIARLFYDGTNLSFVGNIGEGAGLNGPRGLEALCEFDRIYVCDTGNSRVVRLTYQGQFVVASETPSAWGPFTPVDIAYRGLYWDDRLYVADVAQDRVVELWDLHDYFNEPLTYYDELVLTFDSEPIAVDADGFAQAYILDRTSCSVVKCDPWTRPIYEYGSVGYDDSLLFYPKGISIFVGLTGWNLVGVVEEWANRSGARELLIDLEIRDVEATPADFDPQCGHWTEVAFTLTDIARLVRVNVVSVAGGDTVRTLMDNEVLWSGFNYLYWDGRDDAGAVVADGYYEIHISGEDIYGSSRPTVPG
jgi:hypothetical protein